MTWIMKKILKFDTGQHHESANGAVDWVAVSGVTPAAVRSQAGASQVPAAGAWLTPGYCTAVPAPPAGDRNGAQHASIAPRLSVMEPPPAARPVTATFTACSGANYKVRGVRPLE